MYRRCRKDNLAATVNAGIEGNSPRLSLKSLGVLGNVHKEEGEGPSKLDLGQGLVVFNL